MDKFLLTVAGVLLTVILALTLRKQNADLSLMLSLCGCALVIGVAVGFLTPVMRFIHNLRQTASVDNEMLSVLLKVTGVAFLSEIACTVCTDAGNTAMGKCLQILSSAVILYLSLPMMTAFLELVEKILGSL